MRRLKLFDNHLDYTEYMDNNEVPTPNVSYCDEENEVHYDNGIRILPENEEIWEEYQAWICDDAEIERDRELFTKYIVTKNTYVTKKYTRLNFVYYPNPNDNISHYYRTIYTDVGSEQWEETPTYVTNDCGKRYILISDWSYESGSLS